MKKIIAIDLDGTLLDSDKKIPESTIEYLKELKEEGNIIVIATGRTANSAKAVTNGADFANYIISDTGLILYDISQEKVIYRNQIDKDEAEKLYNEAIKEDCKRIEIFTNEKYYEYQKYENYYNNKIYKTNIHIKKYEDFAKYNETINHMAISFDTNEQGRKFILDYQNKVNNIDILVMKDSFAQNIEWLEICCKGVNKYTTLERLSQMLDIKIEDVISFGDSPNDIEMIANSGIGVAMANAIAQVKQVSKSETNFSNNEKGVEMWLRSNFKQFCR